MAIILSERAATLSITKVYQERLMKSAELVAKKELVSLSTAIDSAAVKGQDNLTFKLSSSVTKLASAYKAVALKIIRDDIESAGYTYAAILQKDEIVGFDIDWKDESEDEPEEEDVEDQTDISAALAAKSEAKVKLATDMTIDAPLTVSAGQKLTIDLNSNDISTNVEEDTVAIVVDGGEVIINGTIGSEITGPERVLSVINGGKATINGGNFTTRRAGQVMSATGEGSELVINDGIFNSSEANAMAFDGATLTINGGNFNTTDNYAIATNGTANCGGNVITIDNCVINTGIKSNGYEACGIYVANNDTVTIGPNVIINVHNGCGILMRGGDVLVKRGVKINVTTDKETGFVGYVGDNKTKMTQSGIIYHESANYPGKAGMKLEVEDGVTINAIDHSIEILSNETEPNVIIGTGTYSPAYPGQ